MLTAFKGLKPFQLSEYIFLALFAFFVPISWRIATYLMIGLFICTILKGIFEEGFKINKSQYQNRIIYIISIAFWALYAMSFFYSENTTEARIQIGKKLSFLLFPLFFMTSNLSYLTKDRIRTIMYCFVWGILAFYIVNFVWALYDIIFNDLSNVRLTSYHKFFKANTIFEFLHRAHFSIFTCVGLVFCFTELFTTKSINIKILNIVSLLILATSPFFVTSRAGILCEALVSFILWIWLTFVKKEMKTGLITGIALITLLVSGYFAFPKTIDRFTDAIDRIKNGKGDTRLTLRNSYKYAVKENFIFGAGAGDRNDETMRAYYIYRDYIMEDILISLDSLNPCFVLLQKDSDNLYCKYADTLYSNIAKQINNGKPNTLPKEIISEYRIINDCIYREYNAHNQFSDTIIAVGIIGLLLLLGFFIMPFYLWIKNKNFDIVFFSLLFIIAFNCLFESVFERQMGIMFFTFFYFLLFHANFCQQSTDNGQQSSSI